MPFPIMIGCIAADHRHLCIAYPGLRVKFVFVNPYRANGTTGKPWY